MKLISRPAICRYGICKWMIDSSHDGKVHHICQSVDDHVKDVPTAHGNTLSIGSETLSADGAWVCRLRVEMITQNQRIQQNATSNWTPVLLEVCPSLVCAVQ